MKRFVEGEDRLQGILLPEFLVDTGHFEPSGASSAIRAFEAIAVRSAIAPLDPKHAFPVGSRYGRKAPESCRSRYWRMRQELPSIYLFPFGVEACFL